MMLTQSSTPGTDDWWAIRLGTAMGLTFPDLFTIKQYRDGDAPTAAITSSTMRDAYTKWAKTARLVMTDLIVNARTNRQKVTGFRTAAAGDDLGDDNAWANWKRSHMQLYVRDYLNDVGHYGTAYLTVTGSSTLGTDENLVELKGEPLIIRSDGWSMYSVQYASTPWLTEAAIHIGYDPILMADTLTLFRPGYTRTAIFPTENSTVPTDGSVWIPNPGYTWEGAPVQLGWTKDCNVVRQDAPDGVGFYAKHTDTIDRINETILQRSTIIAMQAYRQRAIRGDLPTVYPPDHPTLAGQAIDYDELFKAGPAALWMIPEGAEIWESGVTDITPILAAAKEDIKYLAAVTSTPLYVLSPDAAAGSAEGAALVKEMVSFSVEDLNERADSAFAVALGLAFQAQRDTARADTSMIETIWAPIDRASILQRAAAAPQAKAGGMPQRMIDEKIFGLSPAEIKQARQDRQDDEFDAAATPDTTTDPNAVPAVTDPAAVDPLAVPAIPDVSATVAKTTVAPKPTPPKAKTKAV